jgi:signal transduction histidine kinase
MRTPLTAIQGSSELMGRYNLTDEKRKQIAGMIHSESKRLASMIQTFLDVERLTEGQMNLKREGFPVRELILACAGRARPVAERKSIELHEGPIAEADINGDRELMEYALYNVLTNAVKYSPANRHVSVSAVLEREFLRISVQDQGIGMDAKELKNIFQKFYRTKKAEASGEVGTGIGLSIVEQIVTHHRGRMEVESTPGSGSTFTIVVPAQAHAPSESMSVRQAGSA